MHRLIRNNILYTAAKYILSALLLYRLIMTGSFVKAAVFMSAMCVHELFHLICAKFLGLNTSFSGPGLLGMKIDFDGKGSMSDKLLVYSGGFIGNLFCASLSLLVSCKYGIDTRFFMEYNLLMAAVNLIPSYPLDGGRILESVLEYFFGKVRAAKLTAMIGTLLGTVLFVFGMFLFMFYTDNLILPVLGIFLIYNSDREVRIMNVNYVKSLLGNMNTE